MSAPNSIKKPREFIPAKENRLVKWFFKWYTRWLFKRRFEHVWLNLGYSPSSAQSTLYFANHHLWWDGLSPLLLNEFVFGQRARAIMEDKQMLKYRFFSRIGAFSIDRENARSALYSLDVASDWLQDPGNSLYLYPEGKITAPADPLVFEPGIVRIIQNAPEADVVPIAYVLSNRNGAKPDLFINVGRPISPDPYLAKNDHLEILRSNLELLLSETLKLSKVDNHGFKRFR
jgi:chlorobactene lauroyltransferase